MLNYSLPPHNELLDHAGSEDDTSDEEEAMLDDVVFDNIVNMPKAEQQLITVAAFMALNKHGMI